MHGKIRSHKSELELGLEKATRRNKLPKNHERVEELGGKIDGCINLGSTSSSLLETLGVETHSEREASPFKLSSEILLETEIDRGKTHIDSDSEVGVDTLVVTMA